MATNALVAAGKADTLPVIDLKRPHGFLVWKGKQTAIAAASPYDHLTPYLITSDGEAFGVAELGEAARMVVTEFDGKAWHDIHRYNPEERRRFWPEADVLYVHRIKSWEGFSQSKPYENGQIIEYEFSDEEADLIERSRGLPKQITLQTDAVVLSGGKFVLAGGIAPDLLQASLKAAYEVEPEFSDRADGDTIPLYRLALVREPRPMVKKKSEPGHEQKQEGEMMTTEDTKEQSLDQYLSFIRQQFNDTFIPDGEMYMDLWVREIFDSFLVAEEDGLLYRVNYMAGESDVIFSPRESWVEVEINYAPKGFKSLGKFERESKKLDITITSGVPAIIEKAKAARDALANWLSLIKPNQPPSVDLSADMFAAPFGVMVKEVDGKTWHVTWSTNAFEDREKEIFSTQALETYVDHSMKMDDRGTFDLWHIPGTDFASKEFQAVLGRFLLEAGPYFDNEIGQAAMTFFKEHSASHPQHAPEGWGSSPQYLFLPEDREDGVYDWIWFPKTSTLPRAKAANVWTESTQEQVMTKLTDAQVALGNEIWGAEKFKQMIALGEQKSQDLEAAGVAFKQNSTKEADTQTPVKETPPPDAPATEDDKPTQPAEIGLTEADLQAIAAVIGKQFTADMQPLAEVVQAVNGLNDSVKSILGRVDALEGKKQAKEENELPRFVFSMKRATEAEETVVPDNDGLKEKKPQNKTTEHVEGSMASAYFTQK